MQQASAKSFRQRGEFYDAYAEATMSFRKRSEDHINNVHALTNKVNAGAIDRLYNHMIVVANQLGEVSAGAAKGMVEDCEQILSRNATMYGEGVSTLLNNSIQSLSPVTVEPEFSQKELSDGLDIDLDVTSIAQINEGISGVVQEITTWVQKFYDALEGYPADTSKVAYNQAYQNIVANHRSLIAWINSEYSEVIMAILKEIGLDDEEAKSIMSREVQEDVVKRSSGRDLLRGQD